MGRSLQKSLLGSRVFLLVMIICGILELLSAIRHPSARFRVPSHVPFDYLPFLSAKAATLTSSCIDFAVLLICVLLVADSSNAAERAYWIVIFWIIFLPVFRYLLPSTAVSLWWTGLFANALAIAVSGVFLVRACRHAVST